MLKYWLKLQKSDNCELKGLYENLFRAQSDTNVSNWLSEVRKILISIGTNDVWKQQTVENEKKKKKISEIDSYIDNSNKYLYKYIPKQRNLQQYLCKSISTKCRKILTKFRVSAHKLCIRTGRFDSINRDDRKCTKCNLQDIEDEYHFILKCPYYNEIRTHYIKPYFFHSAKCLQVNTTFRLH